MFDRYEIFIVCGNYPGRWPDWNTTKTRWGARRVVRRLNGSKFAHIHGLVFDLRRR